LNPLKFPDRVDDHNELPYLYWMNKIHKTPYKDTLLDPKKKCSAKPVSIILAQMLTVVKEELQMYCATVYAKNGVNQMLIL
jgi:hypothetical protein